MNKIKITLFLTSLLMFFGVSRAQSVTIDNIKYTISSGQAKVTGLADNNVTELIIPDKIVVEDATFDVTEIYQSAFLNNTNLISVKIPYSVIKLELYSFYGCANLKKIEFENIESFWNIDFDTSWVSEDWDLYINGECISDIEVPNSVTDINPYSLYKCTSIKSLKSTSVTSIGDHAFYNCSNLSNIDLGSVTSIGNYAFYNCSNLSNIELGAVTSIGSYAFYNCSNLSNIELGAVTSIGSYAFGFSKLNKIEFKSIESFWNIDFGSNWVTRSWDLYINGECISDIEVPNSVTDIDPYTLYCCKSLKSLKIPNSVTSIGDHAFYACENLQKIEFESTESFWNIDFSTSWVSHEWSLYINGECISDIEVPNSVTDIDPYKLYYCKSLISLKIPNSVTSIGNSAFANCINLHKIEFESIESIFNIKYGDSWKDVKSGGWDLYIGDQLISDLEIPNSASELENIFMHCMSLESVKIPETICKIGKCAFYDCKGLKSVDIPESVTEICDFAFDTCRNLDVKLPNKLSIIGTHAFSYCWNTAETLDLPETVVSIGSNSFYNYSKLKWLKIPTNIVEIGSQAFDNCFAIKTVEYMSENPCTASENIFTNSIYSNATLYIPAGTIDKYLAIEPWKNFKNIVEVQLTGIDDISEDNNGDDIDYSEPYEVYNFSGLRLNDPIDMLQPGLYIVKQGNTTKKLKL